MRIFKPQRKPKSNVRPAAVGPAIELEISGLSHDGRGIGRNGGKTTFVRGALPGERVLAKVDKQERRFDEAHAVEVLQASAKRVQPTCRHFGTCGGCSLQHMDHNAQIAHKQQVLAEQLQHFGQLSPRHWLTPIASQPWGYRQRAKFAIARADGLVKIGFRGRGSHHLVPLQECRITHPAIVALLAPLAKCLDKLPDPLPQEVEFSIGGKDALGACFNWERKPAAEHLPALEAFCRQQGICHAVALVRNRAQLIIQDEQHPLTYPLENCGIALDFAPGDFTQVNPAVNRQLVATALSLLDPGPNDVVLDLFSGLGNFSLPLALRSGEVIGLEFGEAMVARATQNARRNHIDRLRFNSADLHREDITLPNCDLALLDPPREGAQEVARALARLKPKRIVYVSCNPATLARDGRILVDAGYRLESAAAVDMFPHTSHLEAIALFTRG